MNDYESIPFVTEDGEEVEFYVLEQTTLNGFHYLLVEDGSADPEEEDVVVYIMKEPLAQRTKKRWQPMRWLKMRRN